ncbi:MAG: hypothetical protein AAF602_00130 [Myxococcota bacterium]
MLWTLTAMAAEDQWPEGTTLYVGIDGEVYDVTGGGAFAPRQRIVDLERYAAGQVTFTPDRRHALVSLVDDGEVLAVTPDGTVETFATGLRGPTGLLRMSDGRIIVAEFDDGELVDISAGGDFTDAVPANTGLFGPRNLAEASDGTLYVADQASDAVYTADLEGGPVRVFATAMPEVRGIAWLEGALFAAYDERIVDITAGGDQTEALAFALGADFFSLCVTGEGRLLSGALFGTELWDVTPGGAIATGSPWASQLPAGDTTLGTAPLDPETITPSPADTGTPPEPDPTGDTGMVDITEPDGCGCAADPGPARAVAPWLVVLGVLRRRSPRTRTAPGHRRASARTIP